jgi:hypothetical protein
MRHRRKLDLPAELVSLDNSCPRTIRAQVRKKKTFGRNNVMPVPSGAHGKLRREPHHFIMRPISGAKV